MDRSQSSEWHPRTELAAARLGKPASRAALRVLHVRRIRYRRAMSPSIPESPAAAAHLLQLPAARLQRGGVHSGGGSVQRVCHVARPLAQVALQLLLQSRSGRLHIRDARGRRRRRFGEGGHLWLQLACLCLLRGAQRAQQLSANLGRRFVDAGLGGVGTGGSST